MGMHETILLLLEPSRQLRRVIVNGQLGECHDLLLILASVLSDHKLQVYKY